MKNADGTYSTQLERIVAFLHSDRKWHATFELQNRDTKFGFIGSAGHTRARELARNDVPDYLKGKVERARGAAIGLDACYEYFRWKPRPVVIERSPKERAAIMVKLFDAGAPAERIFVV